MNDRVFRGYYGEIHKWIYGDLIKAGDAYAIMERKASTAACFVSALSVGQYSGRDDAHGVKMYEGDIVRMRLRRNIEVIGYVDFHRGSYGIRWQSASGSDNFSPFTSVVFAVYEVIGNLYETPELLKGEQDESVH